VTIQSIEVGRLALSKKLAERISRVTGASAEWLLENKSSSPMPPLVRKANTGTFFDSLMSRKRLIGAVDWAFQVIESAEDMQTLELFDEYTSDYLLALMHAFEGLENRSLEKAVSHIKTQLDAVLSPTEEELKQEEAHKTWIREELIARMERRERRASVSRQQGKQPRQPRKGPRRNRPSV
jgi:hypothetical protein